MDEWDQGYMDGFGYAVSTVQELVESDPEITVGAVLEALEAERGTLITPGCCGQDGCALLGVVS